jgi:hypothetical protein
MLSRQGIKIIIKTRDELEAGEQEGPLRGQGIKKQKCYLPEGEQEGKGREGKY